MASVHAHAGPHAGLTPCYRQADAWMDVCPSAKLWHAPRSRTCLTLPRSHPSSRTRFHCPSSTQACPLHPPRRLPSVSSRKICRPGRWVRAPGQAWHTSLKPLHSSPPTGDNVCHGTHSADQLDLSHAMQHAEHATPQTSCIGAEPPDFQISVQHNVGTMTGCSKCPPAQGFDQTLAAPTWLPTARASAFDMASTRPSLQ